MITQLELADRLSRESGKCAAWLQGADAATQRVAAAANGYLFSVLLRACGHCDAECANLLKDGMLAIVVVFGVPATLACARCPYAWGASGERRWLARRARLRKIAG